MKESERTIWISVIIKLITWIISDPDGDGKSILDDILKLLFNHRMHEEQ